MTIDPSATPPAPITNPGDALAELVAGNKRFVSGRPEHGHEASAAAAASGGAQPQAVRRGPAAMVSAAAAASGGQRPHAVVVGCFDSRVPLDAIFDQAFGSICV